jgi:hypothetical protein
MFLADSTFYLQLVVRQQSKNLWGKLSQELSHLGSQIIRVK